jgi:hypothetical protein
MHSSFFLQAEENVMRARHLSFLVPVLVLLFAGVAVAQQYEIMRADYGFGDRRVDVTQRLRELAGQNRTFRMGNSTFGVDPYPGKVKSLRIFARDPRGGQRTFEYQEGSTVDGSMFTGWGGGDWGWGGQYQILHAEYGTASSHVDVTRRLQDLARSNQTFRMGNSTFGVDPAPGVVKTLRIYARDPRGRNRTFEYREGSTVDGSMFSGWNGGNWGGGGWDGGWNGPGGGYPGGGGGGHHGNLNIMTAMYGAPGRTQDVAGRLRSMVRNGRLDVTVSNNLFGTDPAPGTPKTLWITYSVNGRQRQTTVQEGNRLSIP